MPNQKDSRLAQLAAIAQLFGAVNGPAQRAQESNQQNALGILGLVLNQQQHQGELGHQNDILQEQQQFHQGELQNQQMTHQDALNALMASQTNEAAKLGLENTRNQGELGHQQAMEALGLRQAANEEARTGNEAAHQQAMMTQQQDAGQRMLQQQLLESHSRMPGATPESLINLASHLGIQGAGNYMQDQANTLAQGQASQLQQTIGPVYSQFGTHPHEAQKALDILWQDPRMQSPQVGAIMQPWLQQQNAALAQPQTGGLPIPNDLMAAVTARQQQIQSGVDAETQRKLQLQQQQQRQGLLNFINPQPMEAQPFVWPM